MYGATTGWCPAGVGRMKYMTHNLKLRACNLLPLLQRLLVYYATSTNIHLLLLPRGSNVVPFWLWPNFGLEIIIYYPTRSYIRAFGYCYHDYWHYYFYYSVLLGSSGAPFRGPWNPELKLKAQAQRGSYG